MESQYMIFISLLLRPVKGPAVGEISHFETLPGGRENVPLWCLIRLPTGASSPKMENFTCHTHNCSVTLMSHH
jgi:hypothetical protein